MQVLERILFKSLGKMDYVACAQAMRDFTRGRDEATPDELWLVEHPPVYTLGQGAEPAEVANGIPIVQSDRGGEITYHGPGQAVLYTLVDLARRGITVKRFVWMLEQCVIDLIGERAARRPGAPGVYVAGAKIAALGIRVARGRAYHGLALNVDMDLSPFAAIDPCGTPGLPVTQLKDIGIDFSVEKTGKELSRLLIEKLEDA